MKNVLLVKYDGEIVMRGKNRYLFENRLIAAIIKRIEFLNTGGNNYRVYKEQGRILVINESGDTDYSLLMPALLKIIGVVAVCPCVLIEGSPDISLLRTAACEYFNTRYDGQNISFKAETKRSDKRYPLTGNEISADVGGYILHSRDGLRVDVHNPDVVLHIELRTNTYIYSNVIHGIGGLPYGCTGRATVLLSGGIDSPVAAFLTARRGVEINAVYFDSPPYTSERAKQKVFDLAAKIAEYTGSLHLYVVPFTQAQLRLYDGSPQDKTTIMLKRAMLRAAGIIAEKTKSLALVTGDSLGQVASQTIAAINAIDSAADIPVLRPLCAMDKQQIVDTAREIGTYDISIRPYEDCCTVFVPKHPETKPKRSVVEKIERRLDGLDNLILSAVENAAEFDF